MNPDNRRLLLDWLKAEKGEARRLAAVVPSCVAIGFNFAILFA